MPSKPSMPNPKTHETKTKKKFSLSKDQARAIRKLDKFFNAKTVDAANPMDRIFVMVGAAGTGKSHCISLIGDIMPATKARALAAADAAADSGVDSGSGGSEGLTLDDLFVPKQIKWAARSMIGAAPPTPDDEGVDSEVTFTAPTNQASKILSKFLSKIDPSKGLPSKAKTIYSALRIQMVEEEGVSDLKFPDEPVIFPKGSILVIDEGSMPPSKLCNYVLTVVMRVNPTLLLLIVGDFVQLPPVGEELSPMLELAYELPSARFAHLREVVRYDSEILTVATRLRDEYDRLKEYGTDRPRDPRKFFITDLPKKSPERKIFTSQDAFDEAIVNFANKRGIAGFKHNRVVAWRNVTVDRYAHLIRTTLGHTEVFECDELVTLKSPLIEMKYDPAKGRMAKKIVASIDSACEVVSSKHSVENIAIPSLGMSTRVNVYHVLLRGEVNKVVKTVDPSDNTLDDFLSKAGNALGNQRRNGGRPKWDEFYTLKESFVRLRYAYSGTAHRMQGSTLVRTFIDVQDIVRNRNPIERIQCLYVGSTRSTKAMYVLL